VGSCQEPLVILVRAWQDTPGVRAVVRASPEGIEVPVGSLQALREVLDGILEAWARQSDPGCDGDTD
jgi:hypothetical protein